MDEIKVMLNERQAQFLSALYYLRPCAMCQKKAWCIHREPLVDLAAHGARVDEMRRKLDGAA